MAQAVFSSGVLQQEEVLSGLLDMMIPGSRVARSILLTLGVDFTLGFLILVSLVGLFTLLPKLGGVFRTMYTASVKIDEDQAVFLQILKFLEKRDMTSTFKNIAVYTTESVGSIITTSVSSTLKLGIQHKRYIFRIDNQFLELRLKNEKHGYWQRDVLYISCLGRSTDPIIKFLQDCIHSAKEESKGITDIYLQCVDKPKIWRLSIQRPNRSIESISIDENSKTKIIKDIELFFSDREFYKNSGIPYRRGYLFSGPPGTGKSSFAYALAGHFNIDIYHLFIQNVADNILQELFRKLPDRCMVLMEDIDTVDLSRNSNPKTLPLPNSMAEKDQKEYFIHSDHSVSLGGLLNALDGVGAQEGRLLVMTTNHKKKLNKALIRAGRVSEILEFSCLTPETAWTMFLSVYRGNASAINHKQSFLVFNTASVSPADFQDYLISNKNDVSSAVEGLASWVATFTSMYSE